MNAKVIRIKDFTLCNGVLNSTGQVHKIHTEPNTLKDCVDWIKKHNEMFNKKPLVVGKYGCYQVDPINYPPSEDVIRIWTDTFLN